MIGALIVILFFVLLSGLHLPPSNKPGKNDKCQYCDSIEGLNHVKGTVDAYRCTPCINNIYIKKQEVRYD